MPDPRSQAAQAQLSAAFSRAVDLSALSRPAPPQPAAGGAAAASAEPMSDETRAARAAGLIVDATDATFEQVLQVSAHVPVVVDLWATWCGPCKQLSPVLEKLAAHGNGAWILAKVDVDANPAISQAFQVQSIPTVVALAGGRPVAAFSGAQPEPQVRDWLKQLLDQLREVLPGIKEAEAAAPEAEPEPEDPRLVAAQDAADRGDFAAAATAYQAILDVEPANAEAAAGLKWSELLGRAAQAPADAVECSDAAPTDAAAAAAAADVEVAAGAAPAAFARLIGVIRATADPDRTAAREHLVSLFGLFAADDPDVMAARRALAAALY